MARVVTSRAPVSVNPLKVSAPLGAALAFLGVEGAIPLFHGSQGCTAFALVALVRHFKEAIPLQTTAMNEVTTILGGADQVEQAIETLRDRAKPRLIGICTTALTETRGEDMAGELRLIRQRRPDFADTEVVFAATPDFDGGLEQGWAKAVTALVDALVPQATAARGRRVNLLAGAHLTPADVEELTGLVEAFGLDPIVLPDLSTSLDGHVADAWVPTALGGTRLDDIRAMGTALCTLAVGESLRPAAEALEARTGVPFQVFPSLTGLRAVDAFVRTLMDLAGADDAPPAVKRQRSRLVDAALDAHFHLGGLRVAIGADPDLLLALSTTLAGLGAQVVAAVTTAATAALDGVPAAEVLVGDLGDLERLAEAGSAQLLITHAHGRQAADRLGLPLVRAGFPIFDRLGAQDVVRVGYRGTRATLYDVANAVLARTHAPKPEDFGGATAKEAGHGRPSPAPH